MKKIPHKKLRCCTMITKKPIVTIQDQINEWVKQARIKKRGNQNE